MALETQEIDKPGFRATVHTLICDVSGKRLAEIIVKEPNESLYAYVKATSPFANGADSGEHKITGVLAFGPVDSPRFPTIIKDISWNEIDGEPHVILEVINDNKN